MANGAGGGGGGGGAVSWETREPTGRRAGLLGLIYLPNLSAAECAADLEVGVGMAKAAADNRHEVCRLAAEAPVVPGAAVLGAEPLGDEAGEDGRHQLGEVRLDVGVRIGQEAADDLWKAEGAWVGGQRQVAGRGGQRGKEKG